MRETWVWSPGWEDALKTQKATHSIILAWRIPWTAESMGSQRIRHDWAIFTCGLHSKIFQENLLKMQNYWHRISRDTIQYLHLKSPESGYALLFPGPMPMVSLTTSPSSPLVHKAMSRERPSPNIAALITSWHAHKAHTPCLSPAQCKGNGSLTISKCHKERMTEDRTFWFFFSSCHMIDCNHLSQP